jgi:hypothetical protein
MDTVASPWSVKPTHGHQCVSELHRINHIECNGKPLRCQDARRSRIAVQETAVSHVGATLMSDGNVIRKGDAMRLLINGGDGWGDPLERPIAEVRRNVLGGFLSPESAREDYGLVIDGRDVTYDPATARLREAKRCPIKMFHRNGSFDPLVRHEDNTTA